MRRAFRTFARWCGALALATVVLAAIPVVWIETQCVRPLQADVASYQPLLPAAHRRNFVDTFLTYPEWSIVHAYEDFAVATKEGGETAYDYTGHITGYWCNLCRVYGVASARGEISTDVKAMLHIIGLSFSAEMGIKGLWENTIGRLSGWLSFGDSPEDRYAQAVADRYAQFLVQTPWYEFPFWPTLQDYWTSTPIGFANPVRALERRVALSLEWGVKAAYAKAMGALAGFAPADLTLRSIVRGLDGRDLVAEPRITLIERLANGDAVVETPRYRAFTGIIQELVDVGRSFVEIAGNAEIFVTVLVAPKVDTSAFGPAIVTVKPQAWPGMERRGLLVPVAKLGVLIEALASANAMFEHAYDY